MTAPYGAWILAPEGRGTAADVASIRRLLDELHPSCSPPDPQWLVHGDDRVTDGTIRGAINDIEAHDGPRMVWIVGDAVRVDRRWYLKTTIKPTVRLRDIWEDLSQAAQAKPNHPIIAVVDICHAADGFEGLPPNLVAFASCAEDEKARADEDGGWLTRQIVSALTSLPGEITANTLQGHLDNARTKGGRGDQRPQVHLGHYAGYVLNRRDGATALPLQSQPITYLTHSELDALVEACKRLGLCNREQLSLLRETLDDVRLDMEELSTPLRQLRGDLLRLNRLPTAPGQMPQLAIWIEQAKVAAGCAGTADERLMVRLRNRVQGRKETLAVRYLASSDCAVWAAQLKEVLGVHPDFDFEVSELRSGEIPDLVFILLGARVDPDRAQLAQRILDSANPPPLLLIQSGDPDGEYPEEARTIRILKEKAGNLVSAATIPEESTFAEVVERSLPALLDQVETPRDELHRRAERTLALANLGSVINWAHEGFERASRDAQAAFNAEEYGDALQCFRSLETKLLDQPTGDIALDRYRLTRTRLNVACCLVNLQKPAEARAVLDALSEEEVLSLRQDRENGLRVLAGALLLVERVERAQQLIEEHQLDGKPQQILAIITQGGRAPADADDSVLSLAVNQALIDTQMDVAAADGLRLMEDGRQGLSVLLGLRGAVHALEGSTIRAAVRAKVPIELREALVDRILERLDQLDEPTHEPHRGLWEALRYSWGQLAAWDAPPRPPASLEGRIEMIRLPWVDAFNEVAEHMNGGRKEEGLEAARRAVKHYPEREPCQQALARAALQVEEYEESLGAARRAFDLLPVPRNRALLARVLIQLKRFGEAWKYASKLKGRSHPKAAWVFALAAHHSPTAEPATDERVAAWHAYQAVQPNDREAWFAPVNLYLRAGCVEEAQDAAFAASERHDFDVFSLARVAHILMLKGDRKDELMVLMKRLSVIDAPQAEQVRFNIAQRMGQAVDYTPDWDALISSGAAIAVSLDEAADFFAGQFKATEAMMMAYNAGRVSAATMVESTRWTSADLVEGALCNRYQLSVALAPGVTAPISDDEPEEWLVDGITLNLMAVAGLLPTLRSKLEAGHRLVLFEDVWQQVFEEPTVLSGRAEPGKLEALRNIQDFLIRECPPEPVVVDDEALAAREKAQLLSWDQDKALSPRQLARQIIPWLTDPHAVRRLECLADPTAATVLPAAVVLGEGLWQTPSETLDLLRGLRAAGRAIHWTARRRGELIRVLDITRSALRAAERATQVMEFVGQAQASGRLLVVQPSQVDLPPPGKIEFLNQAFGRDLAYRACLRDAPRRRWIGADFLPFAWFSGATPADVFLHIGRWTYECWTKTKQTYANVTGQLMTVDSWALYADASQESLDALLSLGFAEVLDVEALRRFQRRGLNEPRVTEVFDRLETMATNPQHAGSQVARLALARRYAASMVSLWLGDEGGQSWSAETELTRFLLARLEGPLSALPGSSGLIIALWLVCSILQSDPARALTPQGESLTISETSPPGCLARTVVEWVRERPTRVADLLRVLARMLAEKVQHARLHILLALLADPFIPSQDAFSIPPILESASIISSDWNSDPLDIFRFDIEDKEVSYGEMLALAAESLPSGELHLDPHLLRIGVVIEPVPSIRAPFWSTAEALLLRCSPDEVQGIAQDFAYWVATTDGRLAALARQLAEAPEDADVREAFARHAVLSPWRLVRRQPTQFLRWGKGTPLPSNWPATMADLRALLSETVSVEEDGVWSTRRLDWLKEEPARRQFIHLWGEVPGNTSADAALQIARFADDPAETFADVREVLERPDEHPAGRLALYLLVARFLAVWHPVLSVGDAEIDLQAWLREHLPKLISAVCLDSPLDNGDPESDNQRRQSDATLREAEVDLLRICRFVIIQVPDVNSTPAKELPWILFRLYGWLIHQLEQLPPERLTEGISALRGELRRLPYSEHRWPEAFDPERFANDPRRYRSLVLLYGFLRMEQVAMLTRGESSDDFQPTSDTLLEQLIELAERPMAEDEVQGPHANPPTYLEWSAPVGVPELAVRVLLQFDATRWSRLTEETRSRWLRHLYESDGPSAMMDRHMLWMVIAMNAESMTDSEHQQSCKWLDNEPSWTMVHINSWLSLAWKAPIELERAGEAIHAVDDEKIRTYLFSRLLRVYWRRGPEQFEGAVQAQIQRAQTAGHELVSYIAGVGTLLDDTDGQLIESAAAVLRGLLYTSSHRDDERLSSIREKVPEVHDA